MQDVFGRTLPDNLEIRMTLGEASAALFLVSTGAIDLDEMKRRLATVPQLLRGTAEQAKNSSLVSDQALPGDLLRAAAYTLPGESLVDVGEGLEELAARIEAVESGADEPTDELMEELDRLASYLAEIDAVPTDVNGLLQ